MGILIQIFHRDHPSYPQSIKTDYLKTRSLTKIHRSVMAFVDTYNALNTFKYIGIGMSCRKISSQDRQWSDTSGIDHNDIAIINCRVAFVHFVFKIKCVHFVNPFFCISKFMFFHLISLKFNSQPFLFYFLSHTNFVSEILSKINSWYAYHEFISERNSNSHFADQ